MNIRFSKASAMELFEAREYYFLEGASVVQMFNAELRQFPTPLALKR